MTGERIVKMGQANLCVRGSGKVNGRPERMCLDAALSSFLVPRGQLSTKTFSRIIQSAF